jgi:hypothetical protein
MQNSNFGETSETPVATSQEMIEQLAQQWQQLPEPGPEDLRQILRLALTLSGEYQSAALTAVAHHLANGFVLHFFQLLDIFYQKAEEEGITSAERAACLHDVLNELLTRLIGSNRALSIHSIQNLSTFSAFVKHLQTLSHAETAEDARIWMYELPTLYQDELQRENLLVGS